MAAYVYGGGSLTPERMSARVPAEVVTGLGEGLVVNCGVALDIGLLVLEVFTFDVNVLFSESNVFARTAIVESTLEVFLIPTLRTEAFDVDTLLLGNFLGPYFPP